MTEEDKTQSNFNHSEWRQENFLTAAADRTLTPQEFREQMVRNAGTPPLNNEQVLKAMNDLCVGNPVPEFPGIERLYADPYVPGQKHALFSFVPAKGAKPDSDGVYGMAKIRGSFDNPMELQQREEFLIRNVDSYHKIQRPWVGRPFPITLDPKYSAEVTEVDIRKKTTEVISHDIRQQKRDEQKEMKDIEDRAEKLREDTGKDVGEEDPMELYTTLKVKLSQLSWTYMEQQKQLKQVKGIIIKTRRELKEMDDKDPSYRQAVYDKYMKAREDSGLPRDDNSFIKYLVEDAVLDFDEPVSDPLPDDGDEGPSQLDEQSNQ
jgi:hypothetical protein